MVDWYMEIRPSAANAIPNENTVMSALAREDKRIRHDLILVPPLFTSST
jgi:hypothetical protein